MGPLAAILTLVVALATCLGYGAGWLHLLRRPPGRDPLRLAGATALGMGTLAYLVLAAGLLGLLRPPVLAGLVAGGLALGLALLAPLGARRKKLSVAAPAAPVAAPPLSAERLLALAATAACGLLALATLLSALRPVDGLDWDSLSYHLAAPKIYLREGRISLIAYDSHTNFPFTLEMLYTLGLAFGGMGGAKLFHWAAGWLTALAVGAWTARLQVRGRPLPAWAGPAAAGVFASMPLVLWEMGTAYVDLGTALFQFLALATLLDGIRIEGGRPSVEPRAAALAGLFSGFALGTKYTALLQFGLLGLGLLAVALLAARRAPRPEDARAEWRALLLFAALGLLVGSPWYVKNWLWVHNPVYPFFYSLFPQSFSWNRAFELAYSGEQKSFGLGRSVEAVAMLLWNLGLRGRAFFIAGGHPLGDTVGSLGPVFAGLLPLALWARGLGWRVWALLAYGAASIAAWLWMSQQSRYLMPVFAPLSAAAVALLCGLESRILRGAAGLFLAASLALNATMHAPLALLSARVLSGEIDEATFLRATLGPLHEAVGFVNGLPPNSRVALYNETRGFYFDRNYFWANPGQHDLIPYDRLPDGEALAREWRRFGITHVLVNFGGFGENVRTRWYRLIRDAIQRGRLEEVYRTQGAELERRGIVIYRVP